MRAEDIITLVDDGKLDKILRPLNEACVARLRYLRDKKMRRNARDLVIGTRVVVVEGIKPKYMKGAVGEVIGTPTFAQHDVRKQGYVWVDFKQRVGRYGPICRMPANCLKKEDA
jgi:hypothetical protein